MLFTVLHISLSVQKHHPPRTKAVHFRCAQEEPKLKQKHVRFGNQEAKCSWVGVGPYPSDCRTAAALTTDGLSVWPRQLDCTFSCERPQT